LIFISLPVLGFFIVLFRTSFGSNDVSFFISDLSLASISLPNISVFFGSSFLGSSFPNINVLPPFTFEYACDTLPA